MERRWESRLIELAGDHSRDAHGKVLLTQGKDPVLEAAYGVSDAITRRHSKSFHLASGLLPASKRQAIRALYAFCRTVDDIVDACSQCDQDADLEAWRQIIGGALAPGDDPVAAAWMDTLTRFHIPRHYALQLIDGIATDVAATRYESFEDLSTYCYGVASTVGLMSMHIIGFTSREALPYAIKLGVALQMTNILRDVGEDLRSGRIYLPQDELRAFRITESDLGNGTVSDRWREFMRFQIDRTRNLYAESSPGIQMLQRDGQIAIATASGLYRAILEKIEQNGFDVFTRRASLGPWEKLSRIPALAADVLSRRHS